jgi:glycosyltransferase involved in cell wall biosynthesis
LPRASGVSIGMLSRNRPMFLKEAVKALYRWPGRDFELLVYSNGSNPETYRIEQQLSKKYGFSLIRSENNDGFRAIPRLLRAARFKYYVWYEDDFLWVERNWLKKLVKAIENPPPMKPPWKSEWGIISTTAVIDDVTNGAMWADHFDNAMALEVNKIHYLVTQTACGSPFIFNRHYLRKMMGKGDIPTFGKFDAMVNSAFTFNQFTVAHVKVMAYHANQPFYTSIYEDQAKEKQQGERLIEMAGFMKKAKKDPIFNYKPEGKEYIIDLLKDGKFRQYADKLTGG